MSPSRLPSDPELALGSAVRRTRRTERASGFTLIEVMGVVLVMSLLFTAVISFYLNLTRQTAHATQILRDVRRADAVLDRIASDFEHTLLVKKPKDADPLTRPWLFRAESEFAQPGERSSDQVKFIRRRIPRERGGPASDAEMVAYTLDHPNGGPNFTLRRWSRGELPETLDRDFPRSDDPASHLVADDLRYFALRFLDEKGQWQDRWDSTEITDSSELPIAVEIEVALAPSPGEDEPTRDPVHYAREVTLPLRPIDLEALLHPKNVTVDAKLTLADCVDATRLGSAQIPGVSAEDLATLVATVRNAPTSPFRPYADALAGIPGVNPSCWGS